MFLQTRKIVEDQLRDLATLFPRLKHLDLSGYAWLTDSEFAGLKVIRLLSNSNIHALLLHTASKCYVEKLSVTLTRPFNVFSLNLEVK